MRGCVVIYVSQQARQQKLQVRSSEWQQWNGHFPNRLLITPFRVLTDDNATLKYKQFAQTDPVYLRAALTIFNTFGITAD